MKDYNDKKLSKHIKRIRISVLLRQLVVKVVHFHLHKL